MAAPLTHPLHAGARSARKRSRYAVSQRIATGLADERIADHPCWPGALGALLEQRRKLLQLHYAEQISGELFADEERRVTAAINALRTEETHEAEELQRSAHVRERFEEIAAYLADIDVDAIWEEATEQERRVLIDELLVGVEVHGDHLEVVVRGAPRVNVTLEEVGVSSPKGEDWSCRRGDLRLEATPPLTRIVALAA